MKIINPSNNLPLVEANGCFTDPVGNTFHVVDGVLRIADRENYAKSFGIQWNIFDKTQLDCENTDHNSSYIRFFAETRWNPDDLSGKNVLEVGSGAGRFSRVILRHTHANLYSVDYSDSVTANFRNNNIIAPSRFHLFQASIYELPFADNMFDKVFCFGVLQHTPNFDSSIQALINKALPGAEIVVDFYAVKGWWTKISAKYILRPFTKRLSHQRLLSLIDSNIDWLIGAERFLHKLGLGVFTRFLPIADIHGTFPKKLTQSERRERAVLDTFDMFSPEYDNPQRINDVAAMFSKHGADVTFAGFEYFEETWAGVVRAIKRS